jgi:hypothetical protein
LVTNRKAMKGRIKKTKEPWWVTPSPKAKANKMR